jgi:hypothetical protein
MATNPTHKEPAMDTYELVKTTTADAIRIADLINNYRVKRDAHLKAWAQADKAFANHMNGKLSAATVRRVTQRAENTNLHLYDATYQLTIACIDSDLIDQHDEITA